MIINHRSKTLRIEVSDNFAKYKLHGVNIDKLGRVVLIDYTTQMKIT